MADNGTEDQYPIGEGPATRVSVSLPEGTARAIRDRVGRREFSAYVVEAIERQLRGQLLDEYLVDYERRKGRISQEALNRAQRTLDEAFAEDVWEGGDSSTEPVEGADEWRSAS
jgi:hypothetical protein